MNNTAALAAAGRGNPIPGSESAAAGLIEDRAGRLDVLVNNAGITGGRPQEPSAVSPATVRAAVEINVIGVIRVTNAVLPLLRRSASPRIDVKELRDTGILINAACPGYVATDLNGFRGVRTPEEGAAIAIRLATLPDDGPTGGFFDDAGVVPW